MVLPATLQASSARGMGTSTAVPPRGPRASQVLMYMYMLLLCCAAAHSAHGMEQGENKDMVQREGRRMLAVFDQADLTISEQQNLMSLITNIPIRKLLMYLLNEVRDLLAVSSGQRARAGAGVVLVGFKGERWLGGWLGGWLGSEAQTKPRGTTKSLHSPALLTVERWSCRCPCMQADDTNTQLKSTESALTAVRAELDRLKAQVRARGTQHARPCQNGGRVYVRESKRGSPKGARPGRRTTPNHARSNRRAFPALYLGESVCAMICSPCPFRSSCFPWL